MEAVASIQDAMARMGTTPLEPTLAAALDDDGYVILRGAIPQAWLEPLRVLFEEKVLARELWPAPREHGTRHAMLEHEESVHAVCLLPQILACLFHNLRRRFFLATVQGRDPCLDGGYQNLHRDWVVPKGPAPMVVGLAFLDPFGADNGATRLIPGSHREEGGPDVFAPAGTFHPRQIVISGNPGDILIMDGYLAHSGTRNISGAPRRTLQVSYRAAEDFNALDPRRDFSRMPAAWRYLMGDALRAKVPESA